MQTDVNTSRSKPLIDWKQEEKVAQFKLAPVKRMEVTVSSLVTICDIRSIKNFRNLLIIQIADNIGV